MPLAPCQRFCGKAKARTFVRLPRRKRIETIFLELCKLSLSICRTLSNFRNTQEKSLVARNPETYRGSCRSTQPENRTNRQGVKIPTSVRRRQCLVQAKKPYCRQPVHEGAPSSAGAPYQRADLRR